MKEEILRTILELEKRGWITINPHLVKEALAQAFVDELMDMKVSKFIQVFYPN